MPEDVLAPLPPRNGNRMYKKGVQRDAYAVRLRALGWSLEEIATHLGFEGVNGPDRAAAAIRRGLANTIRISRDEQRVLELNSLDELERACSLELRANHVMVSNGRIVRDENDEPVEDDRF